MKQKKLLGVSLRLKLPCQVCLLLQKVPPMSPAQQSLHHLPFPQGRSGCSWGGTKTCLLGLWDGVHSGAETSTQPRPTAAARLLSWSSVRAAWDASVRHEFQSSSTRLTCKMRCVELVGTGNTPMAVEGEHRAGRDFHGCESSPYGIQ